MKINVDFFLFLILTLFVWSCCSPQKERNSFQQVYSLLNTIPDSAIHILKEIDRLSLSEKDQAVYSLLYTMAQDKSGMDVDSDSLMGIAYNYFKEREQDTLYAKCLYYMGKYYLLNDSNRLAEDCFMRAIRISKETRDYYTAYLASNRLAKSLNRSNPKIAVGYAKDAYQIYTERFNDNIVNKTYLLLGISDNYSLAGELDSSRVYLDYALCSALESGEAEPLRSVYQSLSIVMSTQEKNDSALFYSKKAWETATKKDYTSVSNLAYAYLMADSVFQSMELLNLLCQAKSDITRNKAYQLLTECAFRKGNLQQAWEYADSTISIYRRIHETTLKDRTSYFQANSIKLLAIESMKRERERQKYTYIGVGLVIIFLMLLLISYYRNRTLIYRNKSLKIEKEKEVEAVLFKAEKEKHELTLKQNERQIALLKTYIHSIINLQDKIQEVWKVKKRDVIIDDKLWAEIEQFLNAVELSFVTRLKEKYPGLNQNDLRFCMLLRLGFSIRELSQIYSISEDSIKQKQSKFKQKLGMGNSSISLRKYLKSF